MYGYIYETTNLVNGKKYIGQRKFGQYEPYLGSGTHFKRALKKYDRKNFSKLILCECETKEELDRMEIFHIAQVDAVNSDRYYNMTIGGSAPMAGRKFSDEHKRKIGEAEGHRSPETRQRISQGLSGRKLSIEHIQKLSERQKGRTCSEATREKCRAASDPCAGDGGLLHHAGRPACCAATVRRWLSRV